MLILNGCYKDQYWVKYLSTQHDHKKWVECLAEWYVDQDMDLSGLDKHQVYHVPPQMGGRSIKSDPGTWMDGTGIKTK